MIIASAIKFYYEDDTEHRFPQIWTGLRHPDIADRMFEMGVKYDKERYVLGFVNDRDEFLNRSEATYEAINNNQVESDFLRDHFMGLRKLRSEDLWPEKRWRSGSLKN